MSRACVPIQHAAIALKEKSRPTIGRLLVLVMTITGLRMELLGPYSTPLSRKGAEP